MKTPRFAVAALAAACQSAWAIPPGLAYDSAYLMTPLTGATTDKVQTTTMTPTQSNTCINNDTTNGGSCGAFRTTCKPARMGPDDPLLFPIGSVDASHLHTFVTPGVDGNSDINSEAANNSTCKGGTINMSWYWFPSIIDTRNGRPVMPVDEISGGASAYYKSRQTLPHRINTFPVGFRMIAGDSNATSPQSTTIVNFHCQKGTGSTPPSTATYNSISAVPYCGDGNVFVSGVDFGSCIALDGEAPFGTVTGTPSTWKFIPTFYEVMHFESLTLLGDVADLSTVVTAGGGAAVPTVTVVRQGTATLGERHKITFNDLTAGQWVEVDGVRYTSTGASTALQVAQALQGGSPLIDSADHKSHVAYLLGDADEPIPGCPATHPYGVPALQLQTGYTPGSAETQKAWRLSSDKYKGPGGYSGHADFRFKWKMEWHRRWVFGCDRADDDCHGGLLSDVDENGVSTGVFRKTSF